MQTFGLIRNCGKVWEVAREVARGMRRNKYKEGTEKLVKKQTNRETRKYRT